MTVLIKEITDDVLEYVDKNLIYDRVSGYFTWRKSGVLAGSKNKSDGYVEIGILGGLWKAHRIAWAICNGGITKSQMIDHIDGNRSNNAIINLRLATSSENNSNIGPRGNNTSGVKGVHFDSYTGKWRGEVCFMGKRVKTPRFSSMEEAEKETLRIRKIMHNEFFR